MKPINPDCRDGKHPACNGDAWNMVTDHESPCWCECHRLNHLQEASAS